MKTMVQSQCFKDDAEKLFTEVILESAMVRVFVCFAMLLVGSQRGYAQTASDADVLQLKKIISLQQNKIKEMEDRRILFKTKRVPAVNSYDRRSSQTFGFQLAVAPNTAADLIPAEFSFSNLIPNRYYHYKVFLNYRAGCFPVQNPGFRWELNSELTSGNPLFYGLERFASTVQSTAGWPDNSNTSADGVSIIDLIVKSPGTQLKLKFLPHQQGISSSLCYISILGSSYGTLTELPYHVEVDAGGTSPVKDW